MNPQGHIEATLRHTKGTAADVRNKGIGMGTVDALTFKIEGEYGVEIGQNDIEMFSIPQSKIMQ